MKFVVSLSIGVFFMAGSLWAAHEGEVLPSPVRPLRADEKAEITKRETEQFVRNCARLDDFFAKIGAPCEGQHCGAFPMWAPPPGERSEAYMETYRFVTKNRLLDIAEQKKRESQHKQNKFFSWFRKRP